MRSIEHKERYLGSVFLIFILSLLCQCHNEVATTSQVQKTKIQQKDSALIVSTVSKITCPKCGFAKTEKLPDDICLLQYTCKNCQTVLLPKEKDCCVFCSYGDVKCPSKQ